MSVKKSASRQRLPDAVGPKPEVDGQVDRPMTAEPDGEVNSLLAFIDEPLVSNPLSDVTRRERRFLLLASLIAAGLTWGGLIPKEISIFGMKIAQIGRVNLLYLLAGTLLYFTIAFALYGYTDIRLRKLKIVIGSRDQQKTLQGVVAKIESFKTGKLLARDALDSVEVREALRAADDSRTLHAFLHVVKVRVFFDYQVPIIIGIGALVTVLLEAGGFPGIEIAVASAAFILAVTITYMFQARTVLRQEWQSWTSNRRMRRIKRLLAKVKKVGKDTPKGKIYLEKYSALMGKLSKRSSAGEKAEVNQ